MAKKDRMKSEETKHLTPEFRVSFPNVFEAVKVNPTDKTAKFSVQMVFQVKETEKSKAAGTKVVSIQNLKDAVKAVIVEKYGADTAKWPKIGDGVGMLKLPFRDGMEPGKKDADGYGEGTVFLAASSVNMPGIVESYAGSDGKAAPLAARTDFYPGCYARATLNAYHWKFMGKEGVSFGLQNLQKLRDGERFGGRGNASNDFDAIEAPAGAVPAGVGATASVADPLGL